MLLIVKSSLRAHVTKLSAILLCALLIFDVSANKRVISVVGPQAQMDASHSYYVELLAKVLSESGMGYELNVIDVSDLTHGRSLKLLKHQFIDVFWTGTTVEREKEYLPIRIPLVKGLLGYRIAIIHQNNRHKFVGKGISELSSRFACQGSHWPDTSILQANGFNVVPVARLDSMFKMLEAGHCDYFPRAIFEGYGELDAVKDTMPELEMADTFLLQYPFPIYYFVHQSDVELANALTTGLMNLINRGELDKFIASHPLTEHLFPLSQWRDKQIIKLHNPLLPANTDVNNEKFWYQF